jgi:deazaflavin-dependent oxidoreductase (nitroreductase family)
MSFDTPDGTCGGRQPRTGLILRLVNKNATSRFRRTGKMLGFNGLILTTVGARSGAERTSPVGWWPGPDSSWLIVAAANGAARNPAWYHNIAAHPDNVQIEVDGRRIGVTAEQLYGRSVHRPGGRSPPPPPLRAIPAQDRLRTAGHPPGTPIWLKPLPQPTGAPRQCCRDLRRPDRGRGRPRQGAGDRRGAATRRSGSPGCCSASSAGTGPWALPPGWPGSTASRARPGTTLRGGVHRVRA